MSGKRRREVARNEDPPPDEDEDDNLQGGNGNAISDPNYTVEELDDEMLHEFEPESVEVQPTDVFTIEEVRGHPWIERNAEENSRNVLYEFPTEWSESNCNQFPQTYFDNPDNYCFQEKAEIYNVNDAHSSSSINKKQMNKIFKNKEDIASESGRESAQSKNCSKNKKDELKGGKASSLEIHNRCQSIESKIFDFNCLCGVSELSDTKERFKCPEHSSDEFADFEDSSASDSFETLSDQKTDQKVSVKGAKSNQGHSVTHKRGNKGRLIPVTSSSSSETSMPASKLDSRNLPSTSKKNHESSDIYFSPDSTKLIKTSHVSNSAEDKNQFRKEMLVMEERLDELNDESSPSKKNFEFSNSYFSQDSSKKIKSVTPATKATGAKNKLLSEMSTIVEVPEENEASNAPVPSYSRSNPLKMRAKVGHRKDRCNVCNVRLGLCAIKCRCGGYYCAKHRYDKEHDCTYDYKTMGAEEIRKNNPKIIAEKVRKL